MRRLSVIGLWMTAIGAVVPAVAVVADEQVDVSPAAVEAERAFPGLRFERPIVLTHAGDGSDRVFVASQLGTIHIFPNRQTAMSASLFCDMSKQVVFNKNENEEGFLGLAFHPHYHETGEFFVYYTTTDAPHTSIVSRRRVSAQDPNRADPDFEEELLRIPQPFWNHNGGTLAFGPDGYLYIALGDGGAANDPHNNGQNLQTLLGAILRIDVDHQTPKNPEDPRDEGQPYAIPADNPFVGYPGLARPEIWAYGLRNVWRFSFDRETGACWAADVGQNLWEEIDLIVKGGNYGWNIREGAHPYKPAETTAPLIDPIYEYDHSQGASITGGYVYRGSRLKDLYGAYIYADFVTGTIWALRYEVGEIVENKTLLLQPKNISSFGIDAHNELYLCAFDGKIYRIDSE